MKFRILAAGLLASATLAVSVPAAAEAPNGDVPAAVKASKEGQRKFDAPRHMGPQLTFEERKQHALVHISKEIATKEKHKLCVLEAEGPKALHACFKKFGPKHGPDFKKGPRGEFKHPGHEARAEGKGGPRHAGPQKHVGNVDKPAHPAAAPAIR